jgi:hypothetical protein
MPQNTSPWGDYREGIKMRWLLGLIIVISGFSSFVFADDIVAQSVSQLNRQIELIEQIKLDVERFDLPRLLVLQSTSRGTLQALKIHGPLHSDTHREFQNLVITYNYSKSFFDGIESLATADALHELWNISRELAAAQGLDREPETLISLSVFDHMKQIFRQLLLLDLDPRLKNGLLDLSEPVARVAEVAYLGDHFKTYLKAIPVCRKLRGLYTQFVGMDGQSSAYEMLLELQGLNEFYIQFGQLDEEVAKQETPL